MRPLRALLIPLLVLTATPFAAQSLAPDSVFDHLIGRWVLRGVIARQQTTHDVTYEWLPNPYP